MDLWFTEKHTDDVNFTIRVKKQLYSKKSYYQEIDVFDTYEFGRVLVLDGFIMLTEKDEFIYHEMVTAVPMAVNPEIKKGLVIGAGDGGTIRELCRYNTIEKIDMVEIDEQVVKIVRTQHEKALNILKENEGKLHEIAKYLLDKETITGEEFMEIYERNDADVN